MSSKLKVIGEDDKIVEIWIDDDPILIDAKTLIDLKNEVMEMWDLIDNQLENENLDFRSDSRKKYLELLERFDKLVKKER